MSNPLPDDDNVSEDIMAYCKEKQGMTGTTYKNHKSVATRFEQWLQEQEQGKDSILEANPPDVRDWVVELNEEGYQGSTIHQYLMTLRAVFDEWMDSDGDDTVSMLTAELEENPANFNLKDYVDTVTTPEKQQFADNNEGVIYLNPSEVRKLRRHVPAPKVRNELVIKMLVQTGLRRGELSNLECDHLDRENQTVTVTAANSKTNKERTVPYNDLDPELTFWLDGGYRDRHAHADDSPYLLVSQTTKQLSGSRISTIVREAAEEADIQENYGETVDGIGRGRITAHSLRSTFVMRLLEAGIPTAKVMELTGHENLETVENYANVLREDAIAAYEDADLDFGT